MSETEDDIWKTPPVAHFSDDGSRRYGTVDEMAKRIDDLEDALRSIVQVDRSRYEHHHTRPDGLKPQTEGGTCWKTPKRIAVDALNAT